MHINISFENPVTNNVVFLIDTSGSIYGDDRLGLIQQAFTMLLENLNDGDYVFIINKSDTPRSKRKAHALSRGRKKLCYASSIALTGHCAAHAPQSTHTSGSITQTASFLLIASKGQTLMQFSHPMHSSVIL